MASIDTITVILRGYFSRHLPTGGHTIVLSFTEATTPRAVIAHLGIPLGSVGLILINRQQATMDTALQPGDTLELLPLLGGGQAHVFPFDTG